METLSQKVEKISLENLSARQIQNYFGLNPG